MQKVLTILPQSIGGRLTTSSIKDGFETNCVKTDIFDTLKENSNKLFFDDYAFVLGYDYGAIEFCLKNNIDLPCINYFSDVIDDIHAGKDWKKYYDYLKKSSSLTFYWDKELSKANNDIKNLFYLPHFVNTDLYKNTNSEKIFDVIFTGRLDTDYRLKTFLNLIKSMPELKFGWFAFEKHYLDAMSRISELEKPLLKKAYQYFVDTEEEMAKVLNSTKMVINFNEQGVSSLNYRTFQAFACETFILNDYRSEGVEYFKDDYIYYKNFDDMVKKVEFYIRNETERKNISKNLRNITAEKFSHKIGAAKILEKAKEIFDV